MAYRHLEQTATNGNVDTSFTTRIGRDMQILYGQVILTTDATVANRRVIIQSIDDEDHVVIDLHSGAVVTASSSNQHHELLQGIFRETTFVGGAIQVPIPFNFIIPNGWALNITVENGVAGDSYTTEILVGDPD